MGTSNTLLIVMGLLAVWSVFRMITYEKRKEEVE